MVWYQKIPDDQTALPSHHTMGAGDSDLFCLMFVWRGHTYEIGVPVGRSTAVVESRARAMKWPLHFVMCLGFYHASLRQLRDYCEERL